MTFLPLTYDQFPYTRMQYVVMIPKEHYYIIKGKYKRYLLYLHRNTLVSLAEHHEKAIKTQPEGCNKDCLNMKHYGNTWLWIETGKIQYDFITPYIAGNFKHDLIITYQCLKDFYPQQHQPIYKLWKFYMIARHSYALRFCNDPCHQCLTRVLKRFVKKCHYCQYELSNNHCEQLRTIQTCKHRSIAFMKQLLEVQHISTGWLKCSCFDKMYNYTFVF